jgi:hypothetical protein
MSNLYPSTAPSPSSLIFKPEEFVRDTPREVQEALLYPEGYSSARILQDNGNPEAVTQAKPRVQPEEMPGWMNDLLKGVYTNNTDEIKEIQNYLGALQQFGDIDYGVVQGAYSKVGLKTAQKIEAGWNNHLGKKVQEYYAKAGVGDYATSIGTLLVSPEKTLDNMELASKGNENWLSFKNWKEHVPKITAMRADFMAKDIKERMESLPEIIEMLEQIHDGHPLDIANSLSLFATQGLARAEEGIRQDALWDSMLMLDAGSIITGAGMAIRRGVTSGAAVTKDLAELQTTGKLLKDAAVTGGGRTVAMGDDALAASFHPMPLDTYFPESVDGIYATTKANLEHTYENIEGVGNVLFRWLGNQENVELLTREGVGLNDPTEFNALWNKAINYLDDHYELIEKNTGVAIEYKIRRATSEGLVVDTRRVGDPTWIRGEMKLVRNTEDDVLGVAEMSLKDLVKQPVLSLDEKLVGEAQRIVGDKARLANVLMRQVKEIYKPLRLVPGGKGRVDAVLRNGDLKGKVFSIEELKAGVQVKHGDTMKTVKLTNPKEIEAYYGVTRWNEELRYAQNFTAYERKSLQGIMQVSIDGNGRQLMFFYDSLGDGTARSYQTTESAERALATFYGKNVDELTDAEKAFVTPNKNGFELNLPNTKIAHKFQAKPFRDKASFLNSLDATGKKTARGNVLAHDSRTGQVVNLTEAEVNKIYGEQSYIIARLEQPFHQGKRGVQYAVVRNSGIEGLPLLQLDFAKGYIPRIAKNAEYAVYKGTSDGNYSSLSRLFGTRTEAEEFAALRNADTERDLFYQARSTRDLTVKELEEMVTEGFGGAFIGRRTGQALYGKEGSLPDYYDSYDAMAMNIDFMSNVLPMNAWRLSVEKRWFNTADQVAKSLNKERREIMVEPNNYQSDFIDNVLPKDNPQRVALEAHRRYINDILKIPAKSEQKFKVSLQQSAEFFERFTVGDMQIPGLKRPADFARKSLLSFSHSDPYSLIRTATFHPMLGAFNWSQLVVQAAGASLAFSMHPLQAPKRLWEMMAMTTVRFMDHRSPGYGRAIEVVAKNAGLKPKEFRFMLDAYRKSGLSDSVLMNADYNAAVKGYGFTKGAFMRLLDSGTLFYQAGERFNIEYTFLQAFANWRKLNPTAKLNDDAIKALIVEHKRIGMDMGPANKQWYQKGAASPIFQFQQVFWKYWGNMMSKKGQGWTAAEKAKVLTTQTVMFGGAAGLAWTPDWLVNGWEQMAGGKGTIDDTVKKGLREGAVGLIAQSMGLDAEVSYRLSMSGQDNFVTEIMKGGGFRVNNLGPWVQQIDRYAKAAGKAVDLLTSPLVVEYPASTMVAVIEASMRATTQGTNYQKSRDLYEAGRWASGNGRLVFSDKEKIGDWIAALGASGGFNPDEAGETYRMQTVIKLVEGAQNDAIEELNLIYHSAVSKLNRLEEGTKEYQTQIDFLMASANWAMMRHGFSEESQRRAVWERFMRQLAEPVSMRQRVIKKQVDLWMGAPDGEPGAGQNLESIGTNNG